MPDQNILTQDEIDRLMESITSDEAQLDISSVEKSGASREVMVKYKSVMSAMKRLQWARENLSFAGVAEARQYLHYEAFSLWLANHRMTSHEYVNFVKREIQKKTHKK